MPPQYRPQQVAGPLQYVVVLGVLAVVMINLTHTERRCTSSRSSTSDDDQPRLL